MSYPLRTASARTPTTRRSSNINRSKGPGPKAESCVGPEHAPKKWFCKETYFSSAQDGDKASNCSILVDILMAIFSSLGGINLLIDQGLANPGAKIGVLAEHVVHVKNEVLPTSNLASRWTTLLLGAVQF